MLPSKDPFFLLFKDLPPIRAAFKSLVLFFLFFLGSLIFAAIVSPSIYHLLQWLKAHFPSEIFQYLSRKSFENIFTRIRWLFVLLCLPWIIYYCRLTSFYKIGLVSLKSYLKPTFYAFIGGASCICLVAILQQIIHFTPIYHPSQTLLPILLKILFLMPLSVLIISLLEEFLFKTIILRLFYTALSPIASLTAMSLFFAYSHFKMPSAIWKTAALPVNTFAGFFVAFWNLFGIIHNFHWIHFLSLTLLGAITGVLFLKTRSLYPSIAFHAGILIPLFIYKKFFLFAPDPPSLLLGTHRLQDGLLTPILLSIILLFVLKSNRFQCLPSSNG